MWLLDVLLAVPLTKTHVKAVKKGTTFLKKEFGNAEDLDECDLVLCKATTHPQEGMMVFYNKCVKHSIAENGKQLYVLDTAETLCTECDDILPPTHFRMQTHGSARDKPRKFYVPAGVVQKIDATRAAIDNDEGMYL